MEKTCFVFFCLLLTSVFARAQERPVREIPQVVVESNKKFFSDDHTTLAITAETITAARHENIGYLLSRKSPALIRSYGSYGSLSSISLHGTGSNHTQISWNGIPLNSPTSGQADLSLLPVGFIQTVEVINGASGSLFGSGTFGGSVNIDNKPDWNNKFTANYSFNYGSYRHSGHLLILKAGTGRIQYHLSAMRSGAENNFLYRDIYRYGAPRVRNSHNAYNETGILQNLYVDAGKGNFLEAGIWYQRKTLEIPAIMGSYGNSNAVQKDSLFRSFISYRKNGTRSALLVRSAYLSDHLNFTDRAGLDSMASINSRIAASRIINEIDYRHFITSRLIAGGGVTYNLIYGRSDNYGGRISENEIAAYGNVKYIFKDLIVNAGIRKEFHEEFNPEPQFSSGIRYMVRKGLVLRMSFSSKFRKPSLNEKYWNPGGNPYLRPEKGYGGEFTVEWNFLGDRTSGSWMETKVTAYYQAVDNWIQWVMTDSLTPVEYKKVHAKGIDTWIEYGFAFTSFKIAGFFNYSLNRSTIIGTYDNNPLFEGNQLIYIPKHTFRVSGDIKYKNLFFGISAAYSGIRETVETGDKSLQLHPFSLFDASLGYIRSIHNVPVAIWCRLDNLFDAEYEIIRSYPVPGRTFHLTLTVGFEKNVKK